MKMKNILTAVAVAAAAVISAACAHQQADAFQAIETERLTLRDSILTLVSGAKISENEVMITEFGAVGDGVTDCKPAFDEAMKQAEENGGAHIIVPEGVYFVKGPIHFVSDVCLDISDGAVIRFSQEAEDYLPVVYTSWEATFLYNYSPFIYGYGLHDVSIIGKGTIDGNAAETFATWTKLERDSQMLTRELNHRETPVQERVFGAGYWLRPQLVQLYDCKDITVEDVFITNSPFWCVHLLKCENIICRDMRFEAERINNDGIDLEYSRNVLIDGVIFDNGDDNVAIKAGRDNDGWATGIPSENIVIRNCKFMGLQGIACGSEMSGGVRNVIVEDCSYNGFCNIAFFFKTNPDRGGFIRNIYVSNCELDEVNVLFSINTNIFNEGKESGHYSAIENVYVDGLRCNKANRRGVMIDGSAEKPVRNVVLRNIEVGHTPDAINVRNADNVEISDCRFNMD